MNKYMRSGICLAMIYMIRSMVYEMAYVLVAQQGPKQINEDVFTQVVSLKLVNSDYDGIFLALALLTLAFIWRAEIANVWRKK